MPVQQLITFILSNLATIIIIIAVLTALIRAMLLTPKKKSKIIDIFIAHIFFGVGLGLVWAGAFHVFMPKVAASYIGWQTSPFQFEVGVGDIGMGFAAILASIASRGFRLAVITYYAIFAYGAAAGHIYQMEQYRNFAPGNSGIIFWLDIIQPTILLFLMWCNRRAKGDYW